MRAHRKRLSDDQRAKIVELRTNGETIEKTAAIAGVSMTTVGRVMAAHKGKARKVKRVGKLGATKKQPSLSMLLLYEIMSVATYKKTKGEAFDAIAALFERIIEGK